MTPLHVAIVLAAGEGTRFGSLVPKQFTEVSGEMMVEKSVSAFLDFNDVWQVLLVIGPKQATYLSEDFMFRTSSSNLQVIYGGPTRTESILNSIRWALTHLAWSEGSRFIIHDSCRPFLSRKIVRKFIDAPEDNDAWVTFQTPGDSFAIKSESGTVKSISKDEKIMALNTPIALSSKTARNLAESTDVDLSRGLGSYLIDLGISVGFVESDGSTRKITWPTDVEFIE